MPVVFGAKGGGGSFPSSVAWRRTVSSAACFSSLSGEGGGEEEGRRRRPFAHLFLASFVGADHGNNVPPPVLGATVLFMELLGIAQIYMVSFEPLS
ncbi:hypothetical protein Tsubulata_049220 [Turnera subulata]|uniref:Uncharacterized protein n=1 Tax=Turnera subulata TaxID=218843 RepID=A0A9Q0FM44_9ROSI|nr:hypothetical protein Tsubulata_049220 [Turnera subulata]